MPTHRAGGDQPGIDGSGGQPRPWRQEGVTAGDVLGGNLPEVDRHTGHARYLLALFTKALQGAHAHQPTA